MRRTLPLLLAASALAFAPAPLPRRARPDDSSISLGWLQGKWKSVKIEVVQPGGRTQQTVWAADAVRFDRDRWVVLQAGDRELGSHTFTLDTSKRPPTIDIYSDQDRRGGGRGVPIYVGLLRRDGDTLQMLYYRTNPEERPASFEKAPAGWWLLTLRRAR